MKTRFPALPFAGLLSAEFISLVGNQIAAVAIPVLVWQQTHATLVTAIAVLVNNLPFVTAALVGGKIIDQFGAWHISIAADLASFISVLTLPFALIITSGTISSFFMLILILLGALFDPTGIAARHTLVPKLSRFAGKRLSKVNAIRGSLEHAADFIGPVIGTGLITLITLNNTFFVNAGNFLLSALLIAVTVPKGKIRVKQKYGIGLFSNVRFIFNNAQLRTLAIIGMITGFVISSFLGLLLLLLASRVFHNTALFGISLSAFSFSATISALLFSKLNRAYSYNFIYYVGLFIIGTGICLSGMVTTPYGVVLSAGLAGAAGTGNPLEQAILQEQTSKENAGHVFAVLPALRFAAGSIGLLVAGLLSQFCTVNKVLLLEGGLLISTSLSGWFIAPLKSNVLKKSYYLIK